MPEITDETQVNIKELEKAVTLFCKNYRGHDTIENQLYINFPDFSFTRIGDEWKATQDLRIVDYSHKVTIKVEVSQSELDAVQHILRAEGIAHFIKIQ